MLTHVPERCDAAQASAAWGLTACSWLLPGMRKLYNEQAWCPIKPPHPTLRLNLQEGFYGTARFRRKGGAQAAAGAETAAAGAAAQ